MMNWEHIRIFLAVARAGGLAGAVATTKMSPPTLGRQMLQLESDLGVTLFDRHRSGYDLTEVGKELFERSKALEQDAFEIERWRECTDTQPVVKIAAGAWTSIFIAQNIGKLFPENDPLRIELVSGTDFLDLSRRMANLAIRNKRPHQTGLACRKIGRFDFAIYGSNNYVQENPVARSSDCYEKCDWVTLSSQAGSLPSLIWLEQFMPTPARVSCSSPHVMLSAVAEGAGLCILPRFIGDNDPRLTAVSESIDDLSGTRWLVSHDDDRHNKHFRKAADCLAKLFLTA